MKNILVFVSVLLFTASCDALDGKEIDIAVLSMSKSIDTSMPDRRLCAEFFMSKEELNSYFKVAEEVDAATSNAESIILTCKYEGKIRINNTEFSYEVMAGGAGFIYDLNGWAVKNYLCRDKCCCSKFKHLC